MRADHLGYLVVPEPHLLREELNLLEDIPRHFEGQKTRLAPDHSPERPLQTAVTRNPPGVSKHPAHTRQHADVGRRGVGVTPADGISNGGSGGN